MKQTSISCILFVTIYFLFGCDSSKKSKVKVSKQNVEFINPSIDSTTTTRNIPFYKLINEYGSLDGQTIQTEGIVYFEFENVAICSDKGYDSGCFWLELNHGLNVNDSLLQLASGQELVIKGTVDKSSKGHLNSYIGTISNVYYLKTK